MRPKLPYRRLFPSLTLLFSILGPLITYLLLAMRGLPSFARFEPVEVFIWVYQVTWLPAILAALLLAGAASFLTARTPYFHAPYDMGRCFSFGAITGALAEAFS